MLLIMLPSFMLWATTRLRPREVTPELVADVGTKKGEKVDYAVLRDGKPILLFECKGCDCNLQCARLTPYRYFSVTEARFGILTNGIVYRFFSDLDAWNKMDAKPFLEVNMLALDDVEIDELAKFSKAAFNVDAILATASEPQIYEGDQTGPRQRGAAALGGSGPPVPEPRSMRAGRLRRSAPNSPSWCGEPLQEFISDRVRDRLQVSPGRRNRLGAVSTPAPWRPRRSWSTKTVKRVETTADESDAWPKVKAIVAEIIDPRRVAIRDQKSYCAVLFDDNNRRPICRLHFNAKAKRYENRAIR